MGLIIKSHYISLEISHDHLNNARQRLIFLGERYALGCSFKGGFHAFNLPNNPNLHNPSLCKFQNVTIYLTAQA